MKSLMFNVEKKPLSFAIRFEIVAIYVGKRHTKTTSILSIYIGTKIDQPVALSANDTVTKVVSKYFSWK